MTDAYLAALESHDEERILSAVQIWAALNMPRFASLAIAKLAYPHGIIYSTTSSRSHSLCPNCARKSFEGIFES